MYIKTGHPIPKLSRSPAWHNASNAGILLAMTVLVSANTEKRTKHYSGVLLRW